MENSVEIPFKTGNGTAIQPSNPTAGHTHRGNQNERDTCTPVFITALFTTARTWKQPRCPLTGEWVRYAQWNITQVLKRMHFNQF